MKKIISFLFALLISTVVFAASLRDYVCVVRPVISESTTAFLKDYEKYLESRGYKSYAENIEAYLTGSFGSGFIIYGSNGKPYILTNRHVVLEAETATVQFEDFDGKLTEYKNLTIVAVDEDIDIALIALPEDFSKPGLTLSFNSISDGDDVWSAGFPGLGKDPVWQLGKGIVSNSTARIKDLLDPSISPIIQHSAPIDPGNSGGPLMISNSKTSSGYSVIGINTWKAVFRENTNFAIPSSLIKTFMDKAINGTNKMGFNEKLALFDKTVTNKEASFSDMSRFISNDMISTCGGPLFISILQKGSVTEKNEIINAFIYDPIEGLRYTLAYYVYSSFQKNGEIIQFTEAEPVKEGDTYKVEYTPAKGKAFTAEWMEVQGNWKLVDFNNLSSKKNTYSKLITNQNNVKNDVLNSSVKTIGDPYLMNFNLGYNFPKQGYDGGFNFDFISYVEYFGLDFFVMKETIPLTINDEWGEKQGTSPTDMLTAGIGLRMQVPINLNYIIVEPYVEGKLGFSNLLQLHKGTNRFYAGYTLGVDCIVNCVSDTVAPQVGVKYIHSSYGSNKSDRVSITAGVRLGL